MPIKDTIFERLRLATPAELAGIARTLGVPLSGDQDVDVVTVSKELRSAAGHSLANMFRDDHELPYRDILEDVVKAAGEEAHFRAVGVRKTAEEKWMEEYVYQAMCLANRADRGSLKDDEKAMIQRRAESALNGTETDAPLDPNMVGGIAVGILASVLAPAVKKTLPAVVYLIHIRKRIENESRLRSVAENIHGA